MGVPSGTAGGSFASTQTGWRSRISADESKNVQDEYEHSGAGEEESSKFAWFESDHHGLDMVSGRSHAWSPNITATAVN